MDGLIYSITLIGIEEKIDRILQMEKSYLKK